MSPDKIAGKLESQPCHLEVLFDAVLIVVAIALQLL